MEVSSASSNSERAKTQGGRERLSAEEVVKVVSCDRCGKRGKPLKRVGDMLLCEECYKKMLQEIASEQMQISGSYE